MIISLIDLFTHRCICTVYELICFSKNKELSLFVIQYCLMHRCCFLLLNNYSDAFCYIIFKAVCSFFVKFTMHNGLLY